MGEDGLRTSGLASRAAIAMGIPVARGAEKAKGLSCAPITTSKSAIMGGGLFGAKIATQSGGAAAAGETTAFEVGHGLGRGDGVAISLSGQVAISGVSRGGPQTGGLVHSVALGVVVCDGAGRGRGGERSKVAVS